MSCSSVGISIAKSSPVRTSAGLLSFPSCECETSGAIKIHGVAMKRDGNVANPPGAQAVQGHGAEATPHAGLVPHPAMVFTQRHVADMMILVFYTPVSANGRLKSRRAQACRADPPRRFVRSFPAATPLAFDGA
jgi:hypothetical protein